MGADGKLSPSYGSQPAISASGARVAFSSNVGQVYRNDRTAETLSLITHARGQAYASNFPDEAPAISVDGQHIAFYSFGRDLTPNPGQRDEYATADVFFWSASSP
jgi:WD40-like Beta Propeller Repeat